MGATQDQCVDAALSKACQIGLDRQFHNRIIRPTFFRQGNKQRARPAVDLHVWVLGLESFGVSAALDRRLCTDDADFLFFGGA